MLFCKHNNITHSSEIRMVFMQAFFQNIKKQEGLKLYRTNVLLLVKSYHPYLFSLTANLAEIHTLALSSAIVNHKTTN